MNRRLVGLVVLLLVLSASVTVVNRSTEKLPVYGPLVIFNNTTTPVCSMIVWPWGNETLFDHPMTWGASEEIYLEVGGIADVRPDYDFRFKDCKGKTVAEVANVKITQEKTILYISHASFNINDRYYYFANQTGHPVCSMLAGTTYSGITRIVDVFNGYWYDDPFLAVDPSLDAVWLFSVQNNQNLLLNLDNDNHLIGKKVMVSFLIKTCDGYTIKILQHEAVGGINYITLPWIEPKKPQLVIDNRSKIDFCELVFMPSESQNPDDFVSQDIISPTGLSVFYTPPELERFSLKVGACWVDKAFYTNDIGLVDLTMWIIQ